MIRWAPWAVAGVAACTLPVKFDDATAELTGFVRSGGDGLGGVAWLDHDADGDLDLFLPNGPGAPSALFDNQGDGTFVDVAAEAGVDSRTGHSCALAGDIDNDGLVDLFLCGEGNMIGATGSLPKLFHNLGGGRFADITETSGLVGPPTSLSAAFGDIDNDGDLDLFLAAPGHVGAIEPPGRQDEDQLYLNNGDLTFTDITHEAGVPGGRGSCVAGFTHYDDDAHIDLIVGVCNAIDFEPTPFHLYRNRGDLTFTDVAASAGLDELGYWMSVTLGDYDNDGDLDLFSTNLGDGPRGLFLHGLFRSDGKGHYDNVTRRDLVRDNFAWGATFADFDNDTNLDLYYAGSLPAIGAIGYAASPGDFLFGDGEGGFVRHNRAGDGGLRWDYASGVARADYDGDGFVDLVVLDHPDGIGLPFDRRDGIPQLLHNRGNRNRSVTVELVGTRSNRMAIGSRVRLLVEGAPPQVREIQAGSSFASTESPWPVFGLGRARGGDLEVTWPSGQKERFDGAARVGERVVLVEGRGRRLGLPHRP